MAAQPDLSIALIGCGKMGSALLRGWISDGTACHIYLLDPGGLPAEFEDYTPEKITFFDKPELFAGAYPKADIFVVAVKPQIMDPVCAAIKKAVPPEALLVSIAAGQTIASFENRFYNRQPIVRSMPNTPAAIGKGITVACSNQYTTPTHKEMANRLLTAVGLVEWVDDENLMDAATAVSGSGPAYIFLLIETLAKAGVKAGLNSALAMKLARQTVIGSAALAAADHLPADKLRQNVTSPGGTTAAALDVLMSDDGLQSLFDKAIAAATARSRALR
ncbi:MAG: pyrroline-5-carboxylate reductase [Micavibrio aeruginosavorus]|uniref:Pyrroline-5-carboxylate reductase n=1 Tax=Micavibrio aeruginosavorus TaxID=349221 RepID=A0A7T5UGV3_9BACT|nr:MAG: pyrroline-5-carboxylate reductase [Micavibrio aeruginosavorus]